MDWLLVIGLVIVVIGAGVGIFYWREFVTRLWDDFRAEQPALSITNLSILNAGRIVTLTPELENVGPGIAYDCLLQLSGWEGNFSVRTMHPPGARHQVHSIPIVLGPDAPIRMKPVSRCYVRLACRDRWDQRYEWWYPVTQMENLSTGLYDIQIDLSQPDRTEPHPSHWKVWQLVRQVSSDH